MFSYRIKFHYVMNYFVKKKNKLKNVGTIRKSTFQFKINAKHFNRGKILYIVYNTFES